MFPEVLFQERFIRMEIQMNDTFGYTILLVALTSVMSFFADMLGLNEDKALEHGNTIVQIDDLHHHILVYQIKAYKTCGLVV